jgi:DNA repair exonuclease SbcCD nuclease subunit
MSGLPNTGEFDDPAQLVLKALVDLSIREEASLVIIAGDFFDHNRVDATTVELALRELLRALTPVVILPGNHDCLVPDSIYQQTCFSKFAPNIRVFTALEGQRFSFPELQLAIWGKPINSYGGNFRPMAGIPPRSSERWQIAVAHGYYVGNLTNQVNSFQISEEEILESRYDYVALGHWGAFRSVCDTSVKACYAGSACPVVIDLLEEGEVRVRPHPLLL